MQRREIPITPAALDRRWKRVNTLIRERNFTGLFFHFGSVLPKWLMNARGIVITRSESIPAAPFPRNIVFQELRPGDPLPSEALRGLDGVADRMKEKFIRDLEHSRSGYLAWMGDRVVGYAWAAYGHHYIPEVKFDLELQADEVCTYRSFVAEDLRYTRLYPGLARFVLSDLRGRGIRWFIGYGSQENRHSIRTHQRMGYEIIGWITLIEFLGFSLHARKLRAEGNHFRLRLGWQKGHPKLESTGSPSPSRTEVFEGILPRSMTRN